MACVTLKRSLDFDPLHSPSRPIKRRRLVFTKLYLSHTIIVFVTYNNCICHIQWPYLSPQMCPNGPASRLQSQQKRHWRVQLPVQTIRWAWAPPKKGSVYIEWFLWNCKSKCQAKVSWIYNGLCRRLKFHGTACCLQSSNLSFLTFHISHFQCNNASTWNYSYNLFSPRLEFKESVLTPEQIANNLRDEMKRLKKRREFRGQVGTFACFFHKYVSRFDAWDLNCCLILTRLQGPPSPGSAPSSPEPMVEAHMMEGQQVEPWTLCLHGISDAMIQRQTPAALLCGFPVELSRLCWYTLTLTGWHQQFSS